MQSGRADGVILAFNLGLTAVEKNPARGEFHMLHQPQVQLPTCSAPAHPRSAIIRLVLAIARAGLSPFGQALVQFIIVWQR